MVELATDVRSEEPVGPVSLAEVAADVAARFRRRTGKEIVVDADGSGTVAGREAMIDRAVSNLVDNALKFSPDGEAVTVTVHGGTLEVADRGPGIAPDDRARVFDRFYRATSARARCRDPGSDCRSSRRSPRSTGGRWCSTPATGAAPWRASPSRRTEFRRARVPGCRPCDSWCTAPARSAGWWAVGWRSTATTWR